MYSPTSLKTPFLPVTASFWPLLTSVVVFCLTSSVVMWFHYKLSVYFVLFSVFLLGSLMFIWWRDVIRESLMGYHTSKLELSFRYGVMLFILSEVFFFVSFFWAFYDSSLSPSVELGMTWPPMGILPLEVYSIPLLNTVILLSSGVTITWAHHALMNNLYSVSVTSLALTVALGFYFLLMQYYEYCESSFTIADGVYGTTFFVSTGFHGLHVIIGATYLTYVLVLMLKGYLTHNHHFSFEAAAWYWHFVDVVWLFLYLSIYWWGSL